MDRLSLWIEYGALGHHPDVCFHGQSIALAGTRAEERAVAMKLRDAGCPTRREGAPPLVFKGGSSLFTSADRGIR